MMHRYLLVPCALSIAGRAAAQPAEPQPPPVVEIASDRVEVDHAPSISTDALFDPGDTALKAAARPVLDAVAAALAKDASPAVVIVCHTDDSAPDSDRSGAFNRKLSQARAEAVAAYLARHGVAARRLIARGRGSDKPVTDDATDEGKRRNRRVEIQLTGDVRPPDATDLAIYTRSIKGKGALVATIATTAGTLHCQLFDDQAPATVANFIGLATGQKPWTDPRTKKTVANKPFYDGLSFHRVIPHFMIQGGDPLGNGSGGPGYSFDDEVSQELSHVPGTLAMANAGPNTNGSQFFIDEIDNPRLNMHYTVFGRCKEVDVVGKIAGLPRGRLDKPNEPVTITKVTIARAAP